MRDTIYKYILYTLSGEREPYNLRDAPQERINLAGSNEVIENYFKQQLSQLLLASCSLSDYHNIYLVGLILMLN